MRTALVTGAAAGIGSAIAKRLAADGFAIAVADVDRAGAELKAAALRSEGREAHAFAADIADEADVDRLAGEVLARFGRIDVLVNNAGITGPHGAFASYDRAVLRRVIEVDLVGTMLCTQAVLPTMVERREGRIVNLASIAGKDGNPNLAPYAAAKAGVIAFTKSLARELAPSGILVHAIAPGGVGGTSITKAAGAAPRDLGAQRTSVLATTPLGRLATPEEVAALASWLCSPDCSYTTGRSTTSAGAGRPTEAAGSCDRPVCALMFVSDGGRAVVQVLPNVSRDPSVGTFHSVGFPAVEFDAFHRDVLPRRLEAGGNQRIAWDVADAAPFSFRLPEGSAYSYVPRPGRIEIVPGVVDDAGLVIEIDLEAWQDYVHELRTRIGLLYSRAVRFVRGTYDDWDAWEPALRSLYSGTPIYDPAHLELLGRDGKPLALDRKFRLDEDPRDLAHYLRTMGYLVVADVFAKDHLARLSDETDRLRREATEGGLHSWWTRDDATGERYPFHLHYMGLQSESIHALEDDPHVRFLVGLSGADVKPVSERDTGTHAILKEYPAHGKMTSFANLPWHKDCGLGGCPITCPRVHVAVQLDAANADSSQLFMLAGSAGRVCHQPTRPEEWEKLAVVGLQTEPGDATVHMGCGLHAGPRPTGPHRRRTIYVRFDNPRVFDVTAPFETYDQVIPGYGSGVLPSVDEMKLQA